MGPLELVARLVAGVVLILTNAFFVAIEFALTRARQFTESEFVGDASGGLRRAWEMTDDLEVYLTTCQVGITASSIAVGIVAEPALAAVFEPVFDNTVLAAVGSGGIVAFLIINLVHLTHGEQTPTYLGVERSRLVGKYCAPPLYWFHRVISPLITLGDWVAKRTLAVFGIEMTGAWLETGEDAIESRAELRTRLGSVLERGELPADRREEVITAFEIGDRPVSEIMVPAAETVAVYTDRPASEGVETMQAHPQFGRFPLIEGDSSDGPVTADRFVGVVYASSALTNVDRLREDRETLRDVAAPPTTVEHTTSVADAIDRLQAESAEFAGVVRDRDLVGIVTATDAFEAIAGELEDPLDPAASD